MTPIDDHYDSDPNSSEERRVYALDELADDVLLASVDGIGAINNAKLKRVFKSATAALNAPLNELKNVVSERLAQRIIDARKEIDVAPIIQFCRENDVKILVQRDARYPERLRNLDYPPPVLYMRGELRPADRHAISIVGTRRATPYGLRQAARIARELAGMGYVVVSGLALGIDGAAHRAALDARGRTIAVLGGGVARIYPAEHEDLAGRVMNSGALLSEYHPLMEPMPGNFPARNRIVSGLAVGVLVVESDRKGGSMITARIAAEQNREVFAIPGPVDCETSRGCHQLIREGAALVESAEDVVAALPSYERLEARAASGTASDVVAPGTLGISRSSLESIARKKDRGRSKTSRSRETTTDSSDLFDETLKSQTKSRKSREDENAAKEPAPLPDSLSAEERAIAERVGLEPISVDEIIAATGLPAARVLSLVSILEFKNVLARREGNAVVRL